MSENQKMTAEDAKAEIDKIARDNKNLEAFYETQMELMQTQLKFESLRADVKEQQLRALIAEVKMANIMAPAPQPETQKPKTDEPSMSKGNPNMQVNRQS